MKKLINIYDILDHLSNEAIKGLIESNLITNEEVSSYYGNKNWSEKMSKEIKLKNHHVKIPKELFDLVDGKNFIDDSWEKEPTVRIVFNHNIIENVQCVLFIDEKSPAKRFEVGLPRYMVCLELLKKNDNDERMTLIHTNELKSVYGMINSLQAVFKA